MNSTPVLSLSFLPLSLSLSLFTGVRRDRRSVSRAWTRGCLRGRAREDAGVLEFTSSPFKMPSTDRRRLFSSSTPSPVVSLQRQNSPLSRPPSNCSCLQLRLALVLRLNPLASPLSTTIALGVVCHHSRAAMVAMGTSLWSARSGAPLVRIND